MLSDTTSKVPGLSFWMIKLVLHFFSPPPASLTVKTHLKLKERLSSRLSVRGSAKGLLSFVCF